MAHRASPAVGVADAKQHSAPQPRAAAEAALPETALGVAFQDATDISQLRDAHRAPDARVARLRMQRIVVELAGWEFRIRSSTVGFRKVPATHQYTRVFGGLGGAATDAEIEGNGGSAVFKHAGIGGGIVLSSQTEVGVIYPRRRYGGL